MQEKQVKVKKVNPENAFKGQPGRQPARHGTHSGFVRERQAGLDPCDDCRAAHAVWRRAQYLRLKKAKEKKEEDAC